MYKFHAFKDNTIGKKMGSHLPATVQRNALWEYIISEDVFLIQDNDYVSFL